MRNAAASTTTNAVPLAEQFGVLLRSRGMTCATAESCTGGGIALRITSVSGSSDYMAGGVVAYSNEVKERLLGVSRETLAAVGAVSPECATQMARGVRDRLGVNVGLSSTGIAGPLGATARKPVGLVYIAVSTPDADEVRELRLTGDRLSIMAGAADEALLLACALIG